MRADFTTNVGTTGSKSFVCGSHVIRVVRIQSNQHARTEHGECAYCGSTYKRVIRWTGRRASLWAKS